MLVECPSNEYWVLVECPPSDLRIWSNMDTQWTLGRHSICAWHSTLGGIGGVHVYYFGAPINQSKSWLHTWNPWLTKECAWLAALGMKNMSSHDLMQIYIWFWIKIWHSELNWFMPTMLYIIDRFLHSSTFSPEIKKYVHGVGEFLFGSGPHPEMK